MLHLSSLLLATLSLAPHLVHSINFADWAPASNLPSEFRPFLEALVNAAEDPAVTTGYTNYFPPTGRQTTLSIDCQGAERIQACKMGFLAGGRRIVHYPNATSVLSNSATETVYESLGRIQMYFPSPPGNCSQQYYRTQYTVLKRPGEQTVAALPNLTPEPQGQVASYHDVEVWPATLSTDIPCSS